MVHVNHKTIKLPLFHIEYDVVFGSEMKGMVQLLDSVYPGLESVVNFNENDGGYTAVVKSPVFGTVLFSVINVGSIINNKFTKRTIYHEAVHLSWYILEQLDIPINKDSHEMQAYLVEEIVEQMTEMFEFYIQVS